VTMIDGASVLERVTALLASETGMAFPASRQRDLAKVVEEHRRSAGIADPAAYLSLLEQRPALVEGLAAALAIGETYFFRDPAQFELLAREILPDLLRAHGPALRSWSAGCASGEEAYSLAVAFAEAGAPPGVTVLGTDISRPALRRAEDASYGEWSFRGVPASLRDRYFRTDGPRIRVRDEIRERVRFEWHNLAAATYPFPDTRTSEMHLVLCRNVLIYLTPDAVAHVARRLYASLAPGGWLLTSPSDPPLAGVAPFASVVTDAGMVYRRPLSESPISIVEPTPGPAATPVEWPPAVTGAPSGARSGETLGGFRHSVRPPSAAHRVAAAGAREGPPASLRSRLRTVIDAGEHAEAERILASAMGPHRLDAEVQYLGAVVLLEQGRHREAAAAARRALYLDPRLSVAALTLGSALRREGDLRGARRAYRVAARQLARQPATAEVPLGGGERAGGLLRTVESLLALAGADR